MPSSKKTMTAGTVVSIQIRYLHPSLHIKNKYPNPQNGQKLENCTVLRQEVKRINRRDQTAVVVTHEDFKDGDDFIELHAVPRWFKVTKEGPPEEGRQEEGRAGVRESQDLMPQQIFQAGKMRQSIWTT